MIITQCILNIQKNATYWHGSIDSQVLNVKAITYKILRVNIGGEKGVRRISG